MKYYPMQSRHIDTQNFQTDQTHCSSQKFFFGLKENPRKDLQSIYPYTPYSMWLALRREYSDNCFRYFLLLQILFVPDGKKIRDCHIQKIFLKQKRFHIRPAQYNTHRARIQEKNLHNQEKKLPPRFP